MCRDTLTYHSSVRDCLVDHVVHVGLLVRLRREKILHTNLALALCDRQACLYRVVRTRSVCTRVERNTEGLRCRSATAHG